MGWGGDDEGCFVVRLSVAVFVARLLFWCGVLSVIRTRLMEHQRRIVEFCADKDYAAILADYGLGKTLCFLALCQVRKWKRVLVISTKTSVESTWVDEIRRHTDFRYVKLLGSVRKKLSNLTLGLRASGARGDRWPGARMGSPVLFLINYDGVRNIAYELAHAGFDAVVADESTKIKSPRTRRTVHLWALSHYVPCRYIMTGFPVTEGLHNIYAQIKFLDFGKALGGRYWAFLNEHFHRLSSKIVPKRRSVEKIRAAIAPFCVTVPGDVIELPRPVYKELRVDQTEEQRKLITRLKEYFRLELGRVRIDTQYVLTIVQKSLQICDGFVYGDRGQVEYVPTEKDEALLDVLEDIDASRNKVVIWCAFTFSVRKIYRLLTARGIGYRVQALTGQMDVDPGRVVRRFQEDRREQILVMTLQKASESVTLSAARHAVYYSNLWSYGCRGNSEARIRRKGSEHSPYVCYTDLLVRGTPEVKVYECLRKKKNLVEELKRAFLRGGIDDGD